VAQKFPRQAQALVTVPVFTLGPATGIQSETTSSVGQARF